MKVINANQAFLEKTYDEAFNLLVASRDYIKWQEPIDMEKLPASACLKLSTETTRITARLTHIMSWLLFQKAIVNGEILEEDMKRHDFSLPREEQTLLDSRAESDDVLPNRLRELLAESRSLYSRIERLSHSFAGPASVVAH